MNLKILVIDDEESILKTFRLRLSKWGHEIFLASDGTSGIKILSEQDCDVVITDLNMPGISGQEVVKQISGTYPHVKIVVITGYATVEAAVEAMKGGASEFLVKPLNFDHLRIVLDKISEKIALQEENRKLKNYVGELRGKIGEKYRLGNLIGKSKAIRAVFGMIKNVAPLDVTVMIYGETGTGKEVLAKAIHHNSNRKNFPMAIVDCGALAETLLESELFGHEKGAFTGALGIKHGRFEQADEGTIFLDEVENASQLVQKKLLRLIEDKTFHRVGGEKSIKVDVRIIAASNQDLMNLVKQGKFRADLYYRLNVFPIYVPPLKNRIDDIPLLTRHFINHLAKRMGREPMEISTKAMDQAMEYPWPGNVRELLNVIERTLIMTSEKMISRFCITGAEYTVSGQEESASIMPHLNTPLKEQLLEFERNYIKQALNRCSGRINKVIEISGMNPRTLNRKMKAYGLDKKKF